MAMLDQPFTKCPALARVGLELPRRLQIECCRTVQSVTDAHGCARGRDERRCAVAAFPA